MSKSDRPEVKGRPGMRPVEVKDWPGVPTDSEAMVLPPESHTLLDKWWQRVENELDEWEALGRELRGYVEKPEKSDEDDRDSFNRQFYWRPVFGEFRELPNREEIANDGDGNSEHSRFSETVLGKLETVDRVVTYEVVLYDYGLEIWIDAKDMSTPYQPVKFWSYIPEVVTIEYTVKKPKIILYDHKTGE